MQMNDDEKKTILNVHKSKRNAMLTTMYKKLHYFYPNIPSFSKLL